MVEGMLIQMASSGQLGGKVGGNECKNTRIRINFLFVRSTCCA